MTTQVPIVSGPGAQSAAPGQLQKPQAMPLYAQVKSAMIRRIVNGGWKPGSILPSEMRLADEFGVSQGTVRKALDDLAARKIIIRRQGKGTFVTEHDPHGALFHFTRLVGKDGIPQLSKSQVLSCEEAVPTATDVERLSLSPGAMVIRILRLRLYDGGPTTVETIVVPAHIFPGLGEDGNVPNDLYMLYDSRYGIGVTNVEERLRAVGANDEDARLLGVKPGVPLLEIDRTAYASDGTAVERRRYRCETTTHDYRAPVI